MKAQRLWSEAAGELSGMRPEEETGAGLGIAGRKMESSRPISANTLGIMRMDMPKENRVDGFCPRRQT